MLDGKANGRSQRFLSIHSVASSLEKPLLAGQSRLGGHHESVTDICHRRMVTKLLVARPPEMWPFSTFSDEKTTISKVLGCFQDL